MPLLTAQQILALAPDEASRKAGQGLMSPGEWGHTGHSPRAVWGECQGSGSKPYQTAVHTESVVFKCSCPSRKFPCKHGIALLLLQEKENALFPENAEPDWVAEWLNKRAEKATVAATKEVKPVDAAAQAKRTAARQQKAQGGIEELLLWMHDLLRTGLLQLPEKNSRFFEDMGKRLVDAQLSGLAGQVRALAGINFFQEGWQSKVLDAFARLYLAVSAYQNMSDADTPLMQEIRAFLGFPQAAEVLENQPASDESWLLLAMEWNKVDALYTEKYWLMSASGKPALYLMFFALKARPEFSLPPGSVIKGDIRYYPAGFPQRVGLRNHVLVNENPEIPALDGWQEVVQKETQMLAQSPLVRESAQVVAALRLVPQESGRWRMEDPDGRQMWVEEGFRNPWKWLALSSGQFLKTAVRGSEHTWMPLGIWHQNQYIPLT